MWETISSFVLGLTGSVAARVLTSLGLGFVSYQSLNALVTGLIDFSKLSFNSAPFVISQIMGMCGGGTALNIITSALVVKASLVSIKTLSPL